MSTDKRSKIEICQKRRQTEHRQTKRRNNQNVDRQNIEITKRSKDPSWERQAALPVPRRAARIEKFLLGKCRSKISEIFR
jgi:hypothetical protein